MPSLNKCIFIGRLGADPEIRSTGSANVANFRIACTETWKDKGTGERHENTEWVTCVAWRGLAEIASKYLKKGSTVYIEGKFKTRSWEDRNGGGKRYATEIEVVDLKMLDSRPSESGYGNYSGNGGSRGNRGGRQDQGSLPDMPGDITPGSGDDDHDLPF